ncbi:MAG: TVP38/TMEM64 family protein [Clostridia bacterium]|nr:TVP38/TMEM64 family protein [Clostridia bacterium]
MEEKKLTLKKKIIRTTIVVAIIAAVVILAYFVLKWTGAWEYINSIDKIRELILSLGFWGRFVFVFLQFLQVTFLPIPSTVSTLAGVLIYGPLETALLSMAGVMLGSVLAFWLGRTFGKKLVVFMVGEETCEKWRMFLTNAKYSFAIMMLLPVFPDDVLCLVAGLTNMSWTFFVVTNLIARPIGIFTTCYIGSGHVIPYHGWGLAVWAVIIVVVAVLLWLSFKYRDKIENFLQTKFRSVKSSDVDEENNVKKSTCNVEVAEEKSEKVAEENQSVTPEENSGQKEKKKPKVKKRSSEGTEEYLEEKPVPKAVKAADGGNEKSAEKSKKSTVKKSKTDTLETEPLENAEKVSLGKRKSTKTTKSEGEKE